MRLLNKNTYRIVAVALFFTFSINGYSQCKNFTKKEGFPALAPYTHNGQLTSAKFIPGDEAELEMTFNGGNDYRVLIASQEMLGNVELIILDKTRKILFTSKPGQKNPHWDFRVKNTQQLIIQVKVAEMDKVSTNIVPEGCISILTGFRDSAAAEKLLKLSK
jgi:hypothetical protein